MSEQGLISRQRDTSNLMVSQCVPAVLTFPCRDAYRPKRYDGTDAIAPSEHALGVVLHDDPLLLTADCYRYWNRCW
jgi:hypothetical protein